MSMSPNNSNRPPMTIKLEENPVLRSAVAAYKARQYIAKMNLKRGK